MGQLSPNATEIHATSTYRPSTHITHTYQMNYPPLLFSLTLFGLSAIMANAASFDWPQWQGPDRNAVSKETDLLKEWPESGPPLAWKISELGTGFGSPSIADGRIFGLSHRGDDEVVWALSETDGNELWATRLSKVNTDGLSQGKEGGGCTPTVDGDRVYVLGRSGDLVCLRVEDGSVLWRRNILETFDGRIPVFKYNESPLVDGDKVICTPGGKEKTLAALNKWNGETIWTTKVPHEDDNAPTPPSIMVTTPMLVALDIDGNQEISTAEIRGSESILGKLDGNRDGKLTEDELREKSNEEESGSQSRAQRQRRGSSYMRSLKVLAGLDTDESGEIDASEIENSVDALKKLDGNGDGLLDEKEVGAQFVSPPRSKAAYASALAVDFNNQRHYVQSVAKGLVGVAASDGELLWMHNRPVTPTGLNCSTPIYQDGFVCAASAYGGGGVLVKLAVDNNGGISTDEIWTSSDMENHHGGIVVIDGGLYGANGDIGGGNLVCLDFQTGETLWNEGDRDKEGVPKGSLMFADERIYYRTEEGTMLLIEPSRNGYLERSRFEQPDRSRNPAWSHPVIANGRLYLRDQDSLFCYDVKETGKVSKR